MFRVRFSDEEWTTLQEQANAAGMTMSALIRDHLGRVSIRNRKDERQRLIRLNRINTRYGLANPTDPDRARTVSSPGHELKRIAEALRQGQEPPET
ncbi:hypothetical protein DDE84_11615 [Bifidobacterium tibiigranuli]|uniref:Uncharacterized protein n=2 Tax=Bacillati TaxID=1783272 RepID=A0A5N6RY07_9BIFI|nr:hypothetical protein [Bifidobacterium tibiigranuli]KAE8126220.1 hypothetical protein DDE84_11615 [Bifidobacterium tibiigranuli]MCL1563604.1 hypothetical protein [Parasaccharibacter sp. TMW 2.1886]